MKKYMTMMVAAAALTGLAAANDPLIPATVEKGSTYAVTCRGERLFSFVSNRTGQVNVQGVAKKSTDAGDYQVLRLGAAGGDEGAKLVSSVELADFETPGPDCYGDEVRVLEGEIYALVWMKEGAEFKGFVTDTSRGCVVCVDEENNWFYRVYGQADAEGKCVRGPSVTFDPPTGWENGHFAVYVLDTRKPGENELTVPYNGIPTFVKGYKAVESGSAVSAAGWTSVKVAVDGQTFPFDPSLVLSEGYAAIYARVGGQDVWTVRAMPKAWAERQSVNTVFKAQGAETEGEELYILRDATPKLAFPCTNEVDYVFHVAETAEMRALIAKVVANKPLLAAIVGGQQIVPEMLAGFTPEELVLLDGELSKWAAAVMPFFQWNADFSVSFDHDVGQGTVFLDGQYDGAAKWGFDTWVGSAFASGLKAGESIRLLKQGYQEVYLNYAEICTNVIQFKCGAMNLSPANWGTTMRVDLRLYENTGRCNETKSSFSVGVYRHTFEGPLNVRFYSNDVEFAELAICTNHGGRSEFPLPAYSTGSDDLAFTGWTNANGVVVSTIPTMVREATEASGYVKTWYAGGDDTLKLYASFKPAKQLEITVKAAEAGGTDTTSQIKVTKEWLDTVVAAGTSEKTDAEIKEVLEKPVANEKSDLAYWQAYLLGLDPTDPNAELKVEKTNGDEDDKALVVSTVQVSAPDAGIKVGYSLDKVGSDEASVAKEGAEQTTKDLKIDLEPEGETPTGYYKMNVIFTPTEDGVEKEGEKVKIPADNTIGVLKVESDEKLVPIAVPWNSLDNGGEITAAEIVKTSTLSDSDMLHVYDANSDQKAYHNYKLENGEWKWVASYQLDENGVVTKTPAVKPEDDKISRGSGVWLERGSTEKPFYLIGQYKSDEPAKSVVKAPEVGQERPEYSLIAPTGIEDTDLNAVPDLQTAAAENKDDMIVVKRNGISVRYSPTDDGKWGYNKTVYSKSTSSGRVIKSVQTVTDDAKVQAGLGIWYLSKGTEQMEIDWNASKTAED